MIEKQNSDLPIPTIIGGTLFVCSLFALGIYWSMVGIGIPVQP